MMDGSRPCIFISVKWILIICLAIDLINSIVAIPSGLSVIESEESGSKPKEGETTAASTTPRPSQEDFDARKVKLVLTSSLLILFVMLGLVGVSRENFCLSLTVGILMLVETVLSCLTEKTAASILVIIFNCIVTFVAFVFVVLLYTRNRDNVTVAQVEPMAAASSAPVAYYSTAA